MGDGELHDQALESEIELLSVVMAAVSHARHRLDEQEIDLALGVDHKAEEPRASPGAAPPLSDARDAPRPRRSRQRSRQDSR
jgi:hypothetical protein